MKLKRRKYEFRVTGHGHSAVVNARTRGAAVYLFRRIAQPSCNRGFGGVPDVKQVQPKTLANGWWDDVQIMHLNATPKPAKVVEAVPLVFIPSLRVSSNTPQPLAAGLHPATAEPTSRWECKFHSMGPDNNTKPIVNYA